MNIFIMRHGTTVWNEKGITQGRSNNRLSKAGIEITKQVAEDLKDTKFDAIFCSPLMRTMQTANIVNKYHNLKIIKNDLLIELDEGDFTGTKLKNRTPEEVIFKRERSQKHNMESYEHAQKRCESFLNEIRLLNLKNLLIITHGFNAIILEMLLLNQEIDYKYKKSFNDFKNAEVRKFTI